MKLRKIAMGVILTLINVVLNAQVNMQDGALGFNLPIYSYADNVTGLALKTDLSYTSGNGLKVNQVSNAIGTGWELVGIPVISRIVNGLPDDQIEKAGTVFDTTRYPPGYLYNNKSIALGCPAALNKYPIFNEQHVWYDDDNRTIADRELDHFQILLNGRTTAFVINKDLQTVLLDDSRLRINIITGNEITSSQIRTSIKEFDVTDESGIKYIFSEQEICRLYKANPIFTTGIFTKDSDIPLSQRPYVTVAWCVSKIIDLKSGRSISFTYNTTAYKYENFDDLKTEFKICDNPQPTSCYGLEIPITDPANHSYTIYTSSTQGILKRTEIQKKEISTISFPDGFSINFNYLDARLDLAGTNSLSNVMIRDNKQSLISSINLTHSYFIKNQVSIPVTPDEKQWSRLCLTTIQRTGAGNISENPWKFNYYLGSNNTEDFVAPYFFQAKDPWGYYNGSYSGVPTDRFLATSLNGSATFQDLYQWPKVCLYNQAHDYFGGIEIIYNVKSNYARNGLLKGITNPFGGTTEYQYEQNYYAVQSGDDMDSYDRLANGDIAIGGVHLSKITEKTDNNTSHDIITEYQYTDDQGRSSLWGAEALKFTTKQKSYWEAADKYFTGYGCSYHYTNPGNATTTTFANDKFAVFAHLTFAGLWHNLGKKTNEDLQRQQGEQSRPKDYDDKARQQYLVNLVAHYVAGILISCLPDPPNKSETHFTRFYNYVNNNLLPYQYGRVIQKIYSGSNMQSGKTVYEFTSPTDFPLILPDKVASFNSRPRGYDWMYGLPKSIKYYDNSSALVKSIENEYALKKADVQDPKTQSCNCESYYQGSLRADAWNTENTFNEFTTTNTVDNGFTRLKVDFYNLVTGHPELTKSTEKLYDHSGQALTNVVNYTYDPVNNLLASQNTVNSKGTVKENRNYYLEDYDLSAPANSVLNQMKNDHLLNVPISSETWQTKPGGTPEMLSCAATEYGISASGSYRPVKTYAFQNDKPIPQNIIGLFNPLMLVRNNTYIKPVTQFSYGQYFGEPVETTDIEGGRRTSVIFGTTDRVPIASVANASINEVAYSSFELDGGWYTGGWSIVNAEILKEPSPTGDYCLRLFNGSTATAPFPIMKDYKLSFWASSSSFNISGNPGPRIVGPTISGWTYFEFDLPPLSSYITITGNCKMDELRLYPKNASMTTTTYLAGIGKTSECDINNRITYYEYDGLGRITKVLDAYHNILKTYEYHFKN